MYFSAFIHVTLLIIPSGIQSPCQVEVCSEGWYNELERT